MNERIQELEEQCWEPKQYGPPWFNSQKFAELIVQECILTIQMGITRDGRDTEKFLRSMKHIEQIKKHFGVEE
jgi:hypothetical protein